MGRSWIATAAALAALPLVRADAAANLTGFPLTTDDKCTCYKTNSSTANYFANHKFFDFRGLGQYVRTPPLITVESDNAGAPATSSLFTSANWTAMWQAQTWDNSNIIKINNSDVSGSDATILMVNTQNNIYIGADTSRTAGNTANTYMVMRTARVGQFQSASEIDSTSEGFQYLSLRMYARTIGPPGAITAMFTYKAPTSDNAPQTVQESDLEIRTCDPASRIQFTNQPSFDANGEIPQATRNATMPTNGKWSNWAVYRMDWTPGATTWYVNGVLMSTINFQAPRDPSAVMFNSWSDGGSWSGVMANGRSAELQIQWIEMVFNNTDTAYKPPNGGCLNMCSIDETPVTGTPVLIVSGGRAINGGTTGSGGSTGSSGTGGNTGENGSGTGTGGGAGGFGGFGGGRGGSSGRGGSGGRPGSSGTASAGSPAKATNTAAAGSSGHYQNCKSARYGQCAGKTWNGCGSCVSGTTCRFQNDYYSQCL
ncbi:hypothetical protein SCUCBS95973_007762 [Sporothrix curviconia]|uniref:Uncharacterized protein n=1 Tax=Sporothrix curviconia TaxID=1260050 RepID=A0ABP0CG14_9PEZI